MDDAERPSLDETQRIKVSAELRLSDPSLDLGRRLFPRGLRGLIPDERTRFLAVCALVGALAALSAIAFRLALRAVTIGFFGSEQDLVAAAALLPTWKRIAIPAAGAVAAIALVRLLGARGGGGSGVAGIMEAVSLKKGVIPLLAATSRAAGSLFSIGSGGSVGREGPIVQLAAATGSRVGRALGLTDERTRVLCACGAAAGFAAAYNTPMAATLFVVEVIAGTTTVELLGPAAVAAVVSTAVCQLTLGDGPLYGAKGFALVSPLEFAPYIVLALLAAVVSTLFLGVLDAAEWLFRHAFHSRVVRAVAGGLAVGGIGAFLPEVYGNGFETTLRLLDATPPLRLVLVLLAAKLVATACTVGSGGAGGVFTPTLMVGAALGAAIGHGAAAVAPGHVAPAGAYALVGMAALLAATTHAPLMATVFVFEVTRDYAIVLPLLLTCHVAASFAKALRPASIYEEDARRRGVALDRNAEMRALKGMRAIDLYRPVPAVPPGLALEALLEAFASSRATTLYVAREDGGFLGVIDVSDAREVLQAQARPGERRDAGTLARPVPTVGPTTFGTRMLETIHVSGRDEVPVVDQDGALLGVVSRRQLESAVDREVIRRGLRIHDSVTERLAAVEGALSLPPETRLEQVRVPRLFDGRRIGEAGLREKYGLNVLGVVRRGPDGHVERRAVDSVTPLSLGDELVVIGSPDALARFRSLR